MVRLKALLAALLLSWADSAWAEPVDRWAGEIAEASSRFAVPASWIRRVMRAESGGRSFVGGQPVVSRSGAMGLMQLMPGTWRDMRSLLGLGSDPFDPHDNIAAGAGYLRLLYQRFGYPGLFAAYNAGPARYAAFLSGGRALPAETRRYMASLTSPGFPQSAPPARRALAIFAVVPGGMSGRAQAPVPPTSQGLFVPVGGLHR